MTSRLQEAPTRRPDTLFDGYLFDLDGTLYLGDRALPGAVETVAALRRADRRIAFATNNPLYTAASYAAKLSGLGIATSPADVVTSVDALVLYLQLHHPKAAVMVVAEQLVASTLVSAGFAVTADPAGAEVVVVSFDRTFDYAKLNAAYRAVRLHGAALVATNPDPYCPTPDGGLPDCAAILAAVEACTGAQAEAVTGKPSTHLARAAIDRLGVAPAAIAMVGDRLLTDMAMAESAGMTGVLVLSGATTLADLASAKSTPTYVIERVDHLLPVVANPPRS